MPLSGRIIVWAPTDMNVSTSMMYPFLLLLVSSEGMRIDNAFVQTTRGVVSATFCIFTVACTSGCAKGAPRSAKRQGEEQHRHTERGSHTRRDKGEHSRQGGGAQQGRRGNQNSGNREPEWRGWESVRMGGSDNKAACPPRMRISHLRTTWTVPCAVGWSRPCCHPRGGHLPLWSTWAPCRGRGRVC